MAVASPSVAAHTQILVGPGLSPLEGARIDVATLHQQGREIPPASNLEFGAARIA